MKGLQEQIDELKKLITCLKDGIGYTESNPPTVAPKRCQPRILFNLEFGKMWYYYGGMWNEFAGGGADTNTNLANTDLVLDAARTHDLNGFPLVFNGTDGAAGFGFNLTATGVSSASITMLLALVQLQTIVGLNSSKVQSGGTFLLLDSTTGVYNLDTAPVTDNSANFALGYNTITRRLVKITKVTDTDTNIATTDLSFTANRTHDLVSRVLKFIGQVGASYDIEITGPSGVHKLHVDEDDVTMRAEQSATQYSYVDVNVLDTIIEARNNNLRHFLEVFPTYVRMMSGVAGVDGVIMVNASAVFFYSLAGVYKFDKGDGTLALPSISDVTPTHGLAVNAADGRWYRTTKPLIPSDVSNLKLDNLNLNMDGGGSVILTGYADRFIVPFACTITGWTLLETSGTPIACSAVITVKKGTYADYDTTPIFTAISGSEKPTLSNAVANQDLSLSTWTTALAVGEILEYTLDSNDLGKKLLLALHVTKT
jgi:hypothetical protein